MVSALSYCLGIILVGTPVCLAIYHYFIKGNEQQIQREEKRQKDPPEISR